MGIAALTFRKFYLLNYQWQLETQQQSIMESKLELTETISDMETVGSSLSPDSSSYKMLKARKEKLAVLDKKLDKRLSEIKIQSQMVEKELQHVDESLHRKMDTLYRH